MEESKLIEIFALPALNLQLMELRFSSHNCSSRQHILIQYNELKKVDEFSLYLIAVARFNCS